MNASPAVADIDLQRSRVQRMVGPDASAGQVNTVWTLPEGTWWKVLCVCQHHDNSGAAAVSTVKVSASFNGQEMWGAFITPDIPIGAFDGIVSFGIGSANAMSVGSQIASAPIPEMWLPPGTVLTMTAGTAAGVVEVFNPVLILQSAYNLMQA